MPRVLLTLVYLSAVCFAQENADGKWIRFATSHFELLTDADPGKGREVLRRFEEIRQVIGKLITVPPKSGPPLRIFVFRSDQEFDEYKDPRRKSMAALYHAGKDRDYIAMRNTGPDIYRIVFHEYTHLVIKHAGIPVPLWFNEGMGELFSTIETTDSQIKLGTPIPAHVLTLREQPLIDLPTLMSVDQNSPLYNEQSKVGIFYAESWAFVHLLNLNPQYAPSRTKFLELLLQGTSPASAIQQAFSKTSEEVLTDLREYVNETKFMTSILKTGPLESLRESGASIQPESVSEVDAGIALAELSIDLGKTEAAEKRVKRLSEESPNVAAIEEELGDIALARRSQKEALAHYQRAIDEGSRNPRIYFEKANLVRDENGDRDSAIRQIVPDLQKAIEINPDYWQARHLLGYLYFRDGRYRDAVGQLTAAARLEPRNANVRDTLALAQSAMDKKEPALAASPASQEAGPKWQNRKGDQRVEGKLVQLDCSNDEARFHVMVGTEKILLYVADPSKVVLKNVPGKSVQLTCGPFPARPVIVEYLAKPDAQRETAGEITALEFQ